VSEGSANPASPARALGVAATLFAGLLAGLTAERALVQMPAWSNIGIVPWAIYLRTVSSGVGWLLYPAVGLLALLASAAMAVVVSLDRSTPRPRSVRPLAYLATAVTIAGAVVTRVAVVPLLAQVVGGHGNADSAAKAFASLKGWWILNDGLHTGAFLCTLLALQAITRASVCGTRKSG
jgi:hypothetical protein